MDAAESSPATTLPQTPGEDRHGALALVNTEFSRPSGPYDGLLDTESAATWLYDRELVPSGAQLSAQDLDQLLELRRSLRELLDAHLNGASPDPAALSTLNSSLAAAPAVREIHWEETGPVAAVCRPADDPVAAALTTLAEDGVELLTGPPSGRLSACAAPGCTRLFVRNHGARRWCSDRCGNRVRAARHYVDHHPARRRPA
ncbi:CGNR zinc finger domain-containing protein [Streptomyces sp. HUAS TT20]|uniref:CGNR zinc finger domain-containing protein n=1 Tax=Streptomyces sp. HUAS TT20 TaxID=3447509 RepID=UPI0021DB4669|nr:ABATE domain-containing protein [Streptomyces sp. HUAS 15-9]UXY30469.1 ABATE domain-containing protein [Streptomyces sp. HUAS 15-9]